MTNTADIAVEKARMRPLARRMRADAALPGAAGQLISRFMAISQPQSVVAGYWPLGGEIDPRPLMGHLAEAGSVIALPRMISRAAPPVFLRWQADDKLEADAFGVLAPVPSVPEVKPGLVFVPLLAFDRLGGRLGQGGGHYDRVLQRLRPFGVLAVGLAYAGQEMPAIPMEPHDQRLDWVITEREAIACA